MKCDNDVASRKLLGWLYPDPRWGSLQGFLATTYELDADFLETDFLPCVLGIESRTAWTTRIALEKRLSEMDSRAVIVTEARRYRTRPRSLQLELVPAVSARGSVLHAKVTLLVFERAIRFIVGSANLTERGYRKNRESVAVLTASKGQHADAQLINSAIRGTELSLSSWLTTDALNVLRQAADKLAPWLGNDSAGAAFAWSDSSHQLWRTVISKWPTDDTVQRLSIVSPFWSEDAGPTLRVFLRELRQRGLLSSSAQVRLLTDVFEGVDGVPIPILPTSYATFDWRSVGATVTAQAVSSRVSPEEIGGTVVAQGSRSLHAKLMLIEGTKKALAYVGSANFTMHGWGFLGHSKSANVEAGLIITSNSSSDLVTKLEPPLVGEPVTLSKDKVHLIKPPEGKIDDEPWPEFIERVALAPRANDEDELELRINVATKSVPRTWSALLPEKGLIPRTILAAGNSTNARAVVNIRLSPEILTRLLVDQEVWIIWPQCAAGRAVPINVDSAARDRLPISPDQHINETHLLSYYQGKISWEDLFPELNHANIEFISFRENVDTSGPLGRAMIVIIGAIAELERNLIIERVRAGMRRAKLEGRRIGRAPLEVDRKALLSDRARGVSLTELAKMYRISRASVCRVIRESKPVVSEGVVPTALQTQENKRPESAA